MPYVKESVRQRLNNSLDLLIWSIPVADDYTQNEWNSGNVNYVFTKILLAWWRSKPRYVTICLIMGTLFCVALEFYRRVASGYEDRKSYENGDVYK